MAKKQRQLNVFTLSFLDVMAGGFGAVVIIFLIINHATETDVESENRTLLAESRLLDYQVKTGEERLAELREVVGNITVRLADVTETIRKTLEEIELNETELEVVEKASLDLSEEIKRLLIEVDESETEVTRLSRLAARTEGTTTVAIEGEGDRQYLTGLYMGGEHILIALDASASMLDKSIVNVLRRRNMPVTQQLNAPKWQRALQTVVWLTANIPLESKFQIALFNVDTEFIAENRAWVDASDGESVRSMLTALDSKVPHDGTNLYQFFNQISELRPLPDNVFLIADGLPTQGERATRLTKVDGRQRLILFQEAVQALPQGLPINVILFPLEGDPFAAASYWNLAHVTGGTMMSPSEDWP